MADDLTNEFFSQYIDPRHAQHLRERKKSLKKNIRYKIDPPDQSAIYVDNLKEHICQFLRKVNNNLCTVIFALRGIW